MLTKLGKSWTNSLSNLNARGSALLLVAMAFLLSGTKGYAALAEYDGTNLTFTPTDLSTPIINGAVAAVIAGSVLVILAVVVRWIFSYVKKR